MFTHFSFIKTNPMGFVMSFIEETSYVKSTMSVFLVAVTPFFDLSVNNPLILRTVEDNSVTYHYLKATNQWHLWQKINFYSNCKAQRVGVN